MRAGCLVAILVLLGLLLQTLEADARPRRRGLKKRPRPRAATVVARPAAVSAAPATPSAAITPLTTSEISSRVTSDLAIAVSAALEPGHPLREQNQRLLSRIVRLGKPYPVECGGKLVRMLFPALAVAGKLKEERVCGLVQVDAVTGDILAWPLFRPGPAPLWLRSEAATLAWLDEQKRCPLPRPSLETLYAPRSLPARPDKLPGAVLVRGWDALPAKDLEPMVARVEELNASGRLATRLVYDRRHLEPPQKSLAAAAASCADWWRSRLGEPPIDYVGWLDGLPHEGVNPRELDALYRHAGHPLADPSLARDPVTSEAVPSTAEGFGKILTEDRELLLPGPLEKAGAPHATSFKVWPRKYGMDGQFLAVFPGEGSARPAEAEAAALIDKALATHGVLLAQAASVRTGSRELALHGLAVLGRVELGGKPMVIFRESWGDRGVDFPVHGVGVPTFRAVPVGTLTAVYAFPHRIAMTLGSHDGRGHFELSTTASGGRPIDVDALEVKVAGAVTAGVSLGGRTAQGLSLMRRARGLYRLTLPRSVLEAPGASLDVEAECRYFHDSTGAKWVQRYELNGVPRAQ